MLFRSKTKMCGMWLFAESIDYGVFQNSAIFQNQFDGFLPDEIAVGQIRYAALFSIAAARRNEIAGAVHFSMFHRNGNYLHSSDFKRFFRRDAFGAHQFYSWFSPSHLSALENVVEMKSHDFASIRVRENVDSFGRSVFRRVVGFCRGMRDFRVAENPDVVKAVQMVGVSVREQNQIERRNFRAESQIGRAHV